MTLLPDTRCVINMDDTMLFLLGKMLVVESTLQILAEKYKIISELELCFLPFARDSCTVFGVQIRYNLLTKLLLDRS